jgi:hypothetical protein
MPLNTDITNTWEFLIIAPLALATRVLVHNINANLCRSTKASHLTKLIPTFHMVNVPVSFIFS